MSDITNYTSEGTVASDIATELNWKIWIWPTKNRDLGEKIGIMVQ